MKWKTLGSVVGTMMGVTAFTSVASAQDPQPAPPAPPVTPTPVAPPAPAPAAAPAATVAAAVDDTTSDHSRFVGRFGVGYFGLSALPFAGGGNGGGIAINSIQAPVLGVRYWLTEMIGIDGGIGFATTSASTTTNTNGTSVSTDQPGSLGFALHVGVPLALAGARHFSFQIVPEANLGFTSGTIHGMPAMMGVAATPDTDLSGFLLQVGAHVGAEIHFGFIGIPELALQANVGLYVERESVKASTGNNSVSAGQTTFGTTVGSNPWSIFADNVAALYYF